MIIAAAGLNTPPTLVTTDPAAAADFIAEHGQVVYKSISGVRSIVRMFESNDEQRLQLVRDCPVQLQRHVPGDDVRVHVIGTAVIATRVVSAATDYRYAARDGLSVTMSPMTVPRHVAQSCVALTRMLGLVLAGIDLRLTPDGEYYGFEINPSPGFLYYERNAGQPISLELAHLLARSDNGEPADMNALPTHW
jgi:glutathione synthase/RimK-type ligase-like ATP-grasp enzyme